VERFVVRLWLPDRPGALGQVASRIGAVQGDVVGIEILEHGAGRAVDELVVELPAAGVMDVLVNEISQVDGADVEWVHPLGTADHDPQLAVLEAAARVVERADRAGDALQGLCADLVAAFEAEWAAIVRLDPPALVAAAGAAPDPGWLAAFLLGSRHLGGRHGHHPDDVAWTDLRAGALSLAVGRHGRPFRARERRHIALLGRVVAATRATSAGTVSPPRPVSVRPPPANGGTSPPLVRGRPPG
jgi:hypothetical protein